MAAAVLTQEPRRAPPAAPMPPDQVKHFLDYLFVECGLAGNTITAYQRDLCDFWGATIAHCGADLTIQDVQAHLMALQQQRGLCVASIARNVAAIRMFLRHLYELGELKADVASLIESPRKWRTLPKAIHEKQVDALLNAPDPADEYYLRDRALLELLYATGIRVSEAVGLNSSQINRKVGYLRCFGKGGRERVVPIGTSAIRCLGTYTERLRPSMAGPHSGDALFLSRTGRRLDRTNMWRLVRKYAASVSLDRTVSPHTLRHCFATHLLAGGADLRIVQELLGHADVTTTQVYLRVDPSRLKEVHQRYHPRQ